MSSNPRTIAVDRYQLDSKFGTGELTKADASKLYSIESVWYGIACRRSRCGAGDLYRINQYNLSMLIKADQRTIKISTSGANSLSSQLREATKRFVVFVASIWPFSAARICSAAGVVPHADFVCMSICSTTDRSASWRFRIAVYVGSVGSDDAEKREWTIAKKCNERRV